MWLFTSPSCGASSSMAVMVKRNTTMLITIKARVITGHRRAVIFSCLMGINIAICPDPSKSCNTPRQFNFVDGRFPDDEGTWPIFSNRDFGKRVGLPDLRTQADTPKG